MKPSQKLNIMLIAPDCPAERLNTRMQKSLPAELVLRRENRRGSVGRFLFGIPPPHRLHNFLGHRHMHMHARTPPHIRNRTHIHAPTLNMHLHNKTSFFMRVPTPIQSSYETQPTRCTYSHQRFLSECPPLSNRATRPNLRDVPTRTNEPDITRGSQYPP